MALMLPPALQLVSDLSGVWFPNVNEDIIRAHGDAVRVANAGSEKVVGGADTTVRGTSEAYKGAGSTQLQNYWKQTGSESGHMAQISTAAKVAPVALDGIGGVATGTKIAVATVLSVATVRLAYNSLLGPAGGASTIQTLIATRNAGMRIVREVAEGVEKRLGPVMMTRLKGPLDRAAERMRLPGGPGSPALAGAGTARMPIPRGKNAFDDNPGILQRGGRGGRGGGRGRTETNQGLSKKEQEAVAAKEAGKPYDRSAFNSAQQKQKREEKFQGGRNAQKRDRDTTPQETPAKETRREKRARERQERQQQQAQQDGSNIADQGYNGPTHNPDGSRRW
ncbi:hypothetical protein ACIBEJ_39650 [Nonomuraea sp. NPDC050790]|uniref:hypothetical protein n=1 Tax=Nonomuraea sp. NPDC050790 TaxID=3364371 RepID=UPI0037A018FC